MSPTDPPQPTSPPTGASGAPAPSPIRAVLVGLLIGLVSAGMGIVVGAVTLPTSDQLQRASVEEIGLDPGLLDNPLIAPIVDELSGRIQDRVVAEARRSVVLAVAASTMGAVGGVLIVMLASRRRRGASTRDDTCHMR